jgi:hypothetical protein
MQLPWLVALRPIGKLLRLEEYPIKERFVDVRRERMLRTDACCRCMRLGAERIHDHALGRNVSRWQIIMTIMLWWRFGGGGLSPMRLWQPNVS